VKRTLSRLAHNESGSVLIEFALVATVLLILVFGVIDFGRFLFTANNLTAAAREGARFASVLSALPDDPRIDSVVVARAAVLGGTPVTANNVTVTYGAQNVSITVQVSDTFTYLTPVAPLLGLGTTRPITVSSQFRWEQAP
jgi:Flp pilus assembly protein TadG